MVSWYICLRKNASLVLHDMIEDGLRLRIEPNIGNQRYLFKGFNSTLFFFCYLLTKTVCCNHLLLLKLYSILNKVK